MHNIVTVNRVRFPCRLVQMLGPIVRVLQQPVNKSNEMRLKPKL